MSTRTIDAYFTRLEPKMDEADRVAHWDDKLDAAVFAKHDQCLVAAELSDLKPGLLKWTCEPDNCRCHIVTLDAITAAINFHHQYIASGKNERTGDISSWIDYVLEMVTPATAQETSTAMRKSINSGNSDLSTLARICLAVEDKDLAQLCVYPFATEANKGMQEKLIDSLCQVATRPSPTPIGERKLFKGKDNSGVGGGFGCMEPSRKPAMTQARYKREFRGQLREKAQTELNDRLNPKHDSYVFNRNAGGSVILPALLQSFVPVVMAVNREGPVSEPLRRMLDIIEGAYAFVRLERMKIPLRQTLATCMFSPMDSCFHEVMTQICHWQMLRYPELAEPTLQTMTALPNQTQFQAFHDSHRRLVQFAPGLSWGHQKMLSIFFKEEARLLDAEVLNKCPKPVTLWPNEKEQRYLEYKEAKKQIKATVEDKDELEAALDALQRVHGADKGHDYGRIDSYDLWDYDY